jgi:hypothetical protein
MGILFVCINNVILFFYTFLYMATSTTPPNHHYTRASFGSVQCAAMESFLFSFNQRYKNWFRVFYIRLDLFEWRSRATNKSFALLKLLFLLSRFVFLVIMFILILLCITIIISSCLNNFLISSGFWLRSMTSYHNLRSINLNLFLLPLLRPILFWYLSLAHKISCQINLKPKSIYGIMTRMTWKLFYFPSFAV